MRDEVLTEVIEAAGGVAALAKALNVTSQAVSQWDRVPANRVVDVVNATGGKFRPGDLRPDVFKAPPGDA